MKLINDLLIKKSGAFMGQTVGQVKINQITKQTKTPQHVTHQGV